MKSKPDKSDTIIKVAADRDVGYIVKNNLLNNGIDESMINMGILTTTWVIYFLS